MHGYYEKKMEQDSGIDRSLSFPMEERSLCNIRVRELLISNSRTRASNKILAIQNGSETKVIFQITTINVDCVCLV